LDKLTDLLKQDTRLYKDNHFICGRRYIFPGLRFEDDRRFATYEATVYNKTEELIATEATEEFDCWNAAFHGYGGSPSICYNGLASKFIELLNDMPCITSITFDMFTSALQEIRDMTQRVHDCPHLFKQPIDIVNPEYFNIQIYKDETIEKANDKMWHIYHDQEDLMNEEDNLNWVSTRLENISSIVRRFCSLNYNEQLIETKFGISSMKLEYDAFSNLEDQVEQLQCRTTGVRISWRTVVYKIRETLLHYQKAFFMSHPSFHIAKKCMEYWLAGYYVTGSYGLHIWLSQQTGKIRTNLPKKPYITYEALKTIAEGKGLSGTLVLRAAENGYYTIKVCPPGLINSTNLPDQYTIFHHSGSFSKGNKYYWPTWMRDIIGKDV